MEGGRCQPVGFGDHGVPPGAGDPVVAPQPSLNGLLAVDLDQPCRDVRSSAP
jgi:hypothetical protein